MSINDSLPAFPGTEENGLNNGCPGVSIRDYFAAKAMQGLCANPKSFSMKHVGLAKLSYAISDAMLEAKAREP